MVFRYACDHHDIFVPAAQVASDRHSERRGKRGARVPRTIAIVFAFCSQKKTIEPAELAHRAKTIEPAGEHFVHITLMTYIHHEAVARCVEHAMQRNGQLDHAEVRPEVSPGLGKDLDQFIADFLRKLRQILFAQRFDVGGRTDAVEEPLGRGWYLGWLRLLRRA